jgi:hypothetical protein
MATLLPYIFALIYCNHLAFVHESTSTPDDEGQEVLFFFFGLYFIYTRVYNFRTTYEIMYGKFNSSDLFN